MLRMHRIRNVFIICIITLAVYGVFRLASPHGSTPCPRCNIVIIMIDTLRADSLPCYGYQFNTAPNICSFAGKNLLFTHAFSASSWTLPSIMSFFTSLYPTSHEMGVAMLNALNPEIVPLPLYLKNSGYDTSFVSTNQPNVGMYQGLETGFINQTVVSNDTDQSLPLTRKAIDGIKKSNQNNKPAFLFIHTDGVHDYANRLMSAPQEFPLDPQYTPPQLPTPPFTETLRQAALQTILEHITFTAGSDIPLDTYRAWHKAIQSAPTLQEAERIFQQLPAQDRDVTLSHVIGSTLADRNYPEYLEFMRHVYDEHIRRTDVYIKDILTQLEKNNLMDNTIVIISAEHGELLGEDDLVGHGMKMYNPEINVPLIMHVPGTKPARIDDLVHHIDVYPTILDILGKSIPDTLQGLSFRPAVYGNHNGKKNPYIITEWTNSWEPKTIQNHKWKLFTGIQNANGETHELYDLSVDPYEKKIVAADYPQIADTLTKTLYDVLNSQPSYPPKQRPFPDWIDDEHRKNLIETGYFNR